MCRRLVQLVGPLYLNDRLAELRGYNRLAVNRLSRCSEATPTRFEPETQPPGSPSPQQENDDVGLDLQRSIGNALLQGPRPVSRDRIGRHPVDSGLAVRRLEDREHVLEDGLLYPC